MMSANKHSSSNTKPNATKVSIETGVTTGVVAPKSESLRKAVMGGGTAKAASEVTTSSSAASLGKREKSSKPKDYMMISGAKHITDAEKKEASDKVSDKVRKQQEIAVLWDRFAQDRTNNRIRDKLVLHYLHLVKYTVNRLPLTLPNSVSQDDIISYGTLGLLDAIRRFEPERGWKFETFAVNRIRGEVIDQLRSQDWVPRGVRRRSKKVTEVMNQLEITLGRTATDKEMAVAMDVSLARYHTILNECSVLVLSLDEQLGSDKDSSISLIDTVADKGATTPDHHIEDGDVHTHVATAISSLPEREKLLIALYYQENMTLREIGEIINISESRVCQLHAQAIMRLRHKLGQLM